jgi:hypothetical protein
MHMCISSIWPKNSGVCSGAKVVGVKVYLRQTLNFRSHAVSAYISL